MDQLDETQKQVVTMQETLKLLQPQLITATQDVERMLLEVDKERQEVAEFEKVVKIDESVAEVTDYIIYLHDTICHLSTNFRSL